MSANLQHYPVNPNYGSGVFRRRIVRSCDGRYASASLLDDFHEMDVSLSVERGVIVDATASMARYPKTTCTGACGAIAALRGLPIDSLRSKVDRGGQCTHLFDLASLALSWLAANGDEGEHVQVIEIALTDRDEKVRQQLDLTIDGATALSLKLRGETIVEPAQYGGRALFDGFGRWVSETFARDEAELWRLAQMSVFVARGRRHFVDGPEPRTSSQEPIRKGACFSYSGEAYEVARDNIGYVRDMSAGLPEYDKTKTIKRILR